MQHFNKINNLVFNNFEEIIKLNTYLKNCTLNKTKINGHTDRLNLELQKKIDTSKDLNSKKLFWKFYKVLIHKTIIKLELNLIQTFKINDTSNLNSFSFKHCEINENKLTLYFKENFYIEIIFKKTEIEEILKCIEINKSSYQIKYLNKEKIKKEKRKKEITSAIKKKLDLLALLPFDQLQKKIDNNWTEPLKINETEIGQIEISIFDDDEEYIHIVISYDNCSVIETMFPITLSEWIKKPTIKNENYKLD